MASAEAHAPGEPVQQPMDDHALLLAIAGKDREAYAEFFRRFAPRIKGFLAQSLSHNRADEITQEVLLRVWRNAPSYDPARAAPSTWVFAIARNARIDSLRRTARAAPEPDDPVWVPAAAEAPDTAAERKAASERLHTALAQLPEDQRVVLEHAYLKGETLSQISETLQIPLGTVKSRVRLAIQRLRGSVKPS